MFIVAGGSHNKKTEILVEESTEWTELGESAYLPSTAYYGFSASVSLDNKVFMIGNYELDFSYIET